MLNHILNKLSWTIILFTYKSPVVALVILVNINSFITCKNKKIVCTMLSEIFVLVYISAGAFERILTRKLYIHSNFDLNTTFSKKSYA